MNTLEKLIDHLERIVGGPLFPETLQLIDEVTECPTCKQRQECARQHLAASAKHTKEFYANHP